MRFWDSSALVPLFVEQPTSAACRALIRADADVVVWCLSRVEVTSAASRLWREGEPHRLGALAERLDRFVERWTEVTDLAQVVATTERLLRVHPLRAADAMQLAAALVLEDHRPRRRAFVCADAALLAAAAREGFEPVRPASTGAHGG